MAAYETEGAIYAKYIVSHLPNAKIAILSQSDDFGRDYVAGFKRGLGPAAASMIVAQATYETTEPTISSQLARRKSSGANVLFGVTLGKFTSQLIKGTAELAWKPDLMFCAVVVVPCISGACRSRECSRADNFSLPQGCQRRAMGQ